MTASTRPNHRPHPYYDCVERVQFAGETVLHEWTPIDCRTEIVLIFLVMVFTSAMFIDSMSFDIVFRVCLLCNYETQ